MSRAGIPLRRTIALALGATAILAAGVVVVIAHGLAGRLELDMVESAEARAERELAARVEASASFVTVRVEAVAAAVAETVAVSLSPDLGLASELAETFGLDVLELVALDGRTISSAHWPERAGLPSGFARTDVGATGSVVAVPVAAGERLAIVTGRDLDAMRIVGGAFLDAAWLDDIAPHGRAVILRADNARPAGTVEVQLPGPSGVRVASAVPDEATAGRFDPMGWLGWVAIALGLAAVLIGAVWARRWTRPLDDMVDALDAVGRGQADYDFPHPPGDAFGELTASFSRMQRSLEVQRARLREVERVAAWKEAARRVAHEVKNPLAPIRLTMENLRKAKERAPERFDEMFDDGTSAVLDEVERLRKIVAAFGEYAAMPQPRPEPVDLDAEIDRVLALYPGDRIARLREAHLGAVSVDRDQFVRALRNLVGNGLDSSGADGRVVVRTALEDRDVVIEVRDDGPGFGPAGPDAALTPYVTSKPGGTGLGLAITHRIVTEHGGRLIADDRPEGGASITIRLPRTETPS